MKRVRYDNPCPAKESVEEHIDFSWDVPYTVRTRTFDVEDSVPIHYAKTLEILVCKDLKGNITINGKSYPLDGQDQVFAIPPYVLHSTEIAPSEGAEYIIKLDFEALASYLNVQNILAYDGQQVDWLCVQCPNFQEIFEITMKLIQQDDDFFACIGLLVTLLTILRQGMRKPAESSGRDNSADNVKLQQIILWTEENYASTIRIDDAADLVGYSKFYFCTYFKKLTGKSYLDYLNHVRIYNACRLLRTGESVQNVCNMVGFESTSYFIRLFKSVLGMTPKLYVERVN